MIYLTNTDTIKGFVSANEKAINQIKQSFQYKALLLTSSHFYKIPNIKRIPKQFKAKMRKAQRTSFVLPNGKAYRVVKDGSYHNFLKAFQPLYSSSANLSTKAYDEAFTHKACDVIVYENSTNKIMKASKIFQITKSKLKLLRA